MEYEIESFADDVLVSTETRTVQCTLPADHDGPHEDGAWFEWGDDA
jgi:hypothetical protein